MHAIGRRVFKGKLLPFLRHIFPAGREERERGHKLYTLEFAQYGAPQLATEVCTKLNHWDRALRLSNQFTVNVNVNQMFEKHVNDLLARGRTMDAIQLYRKAEKYLEAAELLFEVGKRRRGGRTDG